MSRVNQSHGDTETQRRGGGDKGTRGQGKGGGRDRRTCIFLLFSLSPCPLVSRSLCLRISVAITLILFAVACRQDMQDQPKYKPLAPSQFFSDGKSARQLVEGT